jgi:hypothetical protein
MTTQTALKYEAEVKTDGRIEVAVPLLPGSKVTVFVIQESDTFGDLLLASQSSLEFWNNPYDDEDWNA